MDTVYINREVYSDKQVTGKMITKFGFLHTLELPDLNNQKRISCIPKGSYIVTPHFSAKFGKCFWITNVPNRSEILIHTGNYHTQILGCILVGTGLTDINGDGYKDVTRSKVALLKLIEAYPNGFNLVIK